MASYDEEFKKRIVRMHLEQGRTIKSLSEEYHVSENGIGYMKENLKLRKELEEMRKENEFLKKAAAFFAKEID